LAKDFGSRRSAELPAEIWSEKVFFLGTGAGLYLKQAPALQERWLELSAEIEFRVDRIDRRGVVLAKLELRRGAIRRTDPTDQNAGGGSGTDGLYEVGQVRP
jgi:hypothetical protein